MIFGLSVFEKKNFENNGVIHVYSLRAGEDNPLVSKFYIK